MRPIDATELTLVLGDLLIEPVPESLVIKAITTDTRSRTTAETFVALTGEQFDGHDYVAAACQQGITQAVVEKVLDLPIQQVVVSNTRLALGRLAARVRQNFVQEGGKIVGLTGSAGKTTSKQMLLSILSQEGKTHATCGNLNNDLGVPFTWFDLPDNIQYAVIEMGASQQQEIAYLATITQPDIALVTNAAEAHLQGFGGLAGVAKGKGELFASLTAGKTAIINRDDRYAEDWLNLLADGVNYLTFSLYDDKADVYAQSVLADGSGFTLCYRDEKVAVLLPTVGRHHVMNALGSAACAIALGFSLDTLAKGLSMFTAPEGRLQKQVRGDWVVIDDTYNANPLSMRASAELLVLASSPRLMVLGDMGELGKAARKLHEQLGIDLQDKADLFLCVGEHMRHFVKNNPKAKHYESVAACCSALSDYLKDNQKATVLVKGSRSMKMERIVDFLLKNLLPRGEKN